jgi:HAD superfamily hydrolase (TIGR01509 family)
MQNNGAFKAAIFDMDGLMLDTEPIYKAASQQAAAELGFTISDALFTSVVGISNRDAEQVLLAEFGPLFPLENFRKRWPIVWDEHARTKGIALKPGLLALLDFLESYGLPKAVATSTPFSQAQFCLEKTNLRNRFSVLVSAAQIKNGKPAPDIYLAAAEALKIAPRDCIAFEDSNPGLFAATSAGMRTIMVPDLAAPSAQARARAWRIVSTLADATLIADLQACFTGNPRC